ncbi:RagB/SusD family nutrient uptake outer membrane protein [Flavobacteriaceae bacterium]|jgi:hypothetical protein|nr:RagB/SusD family nutrient uptake outer membrane protein [Flavobacteriaceae bacterium]
MKNIKKYLLLFFAATLIVSCGDADLEPVLSLDKDLASGLKTESDLGAVMNSAYDRMSSSGYYGRNQIIDGDVRTDNMYSNMNSGRFASSSMDYTSQGAGSWVNYYSVIAICNIVIAADAASLEGDQNGISYIQGQAYAVRALVHFDALKAYGQHFITGQGGASSLGVPYVKTYKVPENLTPARGTVASNVADITADLTTAITMMSGWTQPVSSSYMTLAGAYAVGARALLYAASVTGDYSGAASMSKWVIDNSGKSPVTASGFASSYTTDNASNSIFEIAMSGTDNPGINGIAYILRGTSYGDVRILTGDGANPDLLDLALERPGDVRFAANMVGTAQGYPTVLGKFPTMTGSDNVTIIRVEEMHLIYAEAMLWQGDAATALTYLNNIPAIRGLGADYYKEATLANILKERRVEFYCEGLRYDDLLRTGQGMPLIDSIKQLNDDRTGTTPSYGDYNTAMPIYQSELNANSNMVQNYGY